MTFHVGAGFAHGLDHFIQRHAVLAIAARGFHGLFIELKAGKNTTTDLQDEVIRDLIEQGYRVEVCHGWRAAAMVINDYLGTKHDC